MIYRSGKFSRTLLFAAITLCHAAALLIPGCYLAGRKEKKENAFRVKLGEVELNKGPVVGPPERLPSEPAPPAPAEPDMPAPSEPEVPAPAPTPAEPVFTLPAKKQVKPAPKKSVKKKKSVKPKKKTVAKPKKKPAAKPKKKPAVKPVRKTAAKVKKITKPKDDGVFKPEGKEQKIGTGYNPLNNARIPVGSRNAAQSYGKKFDNKAPGGGSDISMERYGKNLVRFLKSRWVYPPKSLLAGKMPVVMIELDIASDGSVTGSRIVKKSGVNAMDQSIERMLKQLEKVPAPPGKRVTLEILMQMTDV